MVEFTGASDFADELRDFASECRTAADEIPDALDRAVELTVRAMAASAAYRAPHDTGKLERSIEAYRRRVGGDRISWGYGTDVSYSRDVEYGTDPHTIRPRNADALRFEVNGETVYAAKVEHPGTDPAYFVRGGFDEHKRDLEANIDAEIGRVYTRAFS